MVSPRITVGVTGGIAAYKAVELVRSLQTAGLDPHVVMTQAATQFITPLTFAAITGHRVITNLWANEESSGGEANLNSAIDHIDEAQGTHALVVAPATANSIAHFAHGFADDFLSTLYLAMTAPVVVAPAMNVNMWRHPATRANLQTLRDRGVLIVEPGNGYLACGMTGEGRLADTSAIVDAVLGSLQEAPQDLAGETVLITAGGTREPLDPVRFLGNRSSGKMGYALAANAARRGARVLLVTTVSLPVPGPCEIVPVCTAEEMRTAVLSRLPEATIVIKAAAVADFRPLTVSDQKLKRSGRLVLELEATPDIAREVASRRRPGTILVVFAAETEGPSAVQNARMKLDSKGADAVFINVVSASNGFESDDNAGTWITPTMERSYPLQAKSSLASEILGQVVTLRAITP